MARQVTRRDARKNRASWDRDASKYQSRHRSQLNRFNRLSWGVWGISEDTLKVFGDLSGRDVLEFGCGAAQWSIALARRGARPVGLDLSGRQLGHARDLMKGAGADFPLVNASAEETPFRDGSFDVVFCDHGAMSFADPNRTVPEVSRILRSGGVLAFNTATPMHWMCFNEKSERVLQRLQSDYFGMHKWEEDDGVEFQLPYGEWIRLFRGSGFEVEDLVELRPGPRATSTYAGWVDRDWARRWPAEHIWKVRKRAE
ncbi:MAG: methyltransferase domain-containing protein [Actinomycetota bacterium]